MSSTSASPSSAAAPARIDPRGQQFAAALTSVVLVVVLLLAPRPLGVALLAAQAVLFAAGAGLGGADTPHAGLVNTVVPARRGAPTHGRSARHQRRST